MKLIHGDCLEKMKDIPDSSVDMILTDPPYGTTVCSWDFVIPFEPMWEQLKRIIKPKGAILIFGFEPFSSLLRVSNLDMYKYDWVWKKNRPVGHAQAKNKPMNAHELISVFSLGVTVHASQSSKRMNYYPQGLKRIDKLVSNSDQTLREGSNSGFAKRPSHKKHFIQENTGYPWSVLEFPKDDKNKRHPTQKPVALLEYLIKTYTLEGEIVLDFTMGSGSTGVACINTNRDLIGIELDKGYYDIACKRIEEAKGAYCNDSN